MSVSRQSAATAVVRSTLGMHSAVSLCTTRSDCSVANLVGYSSTAACTILLSDTVTQTYSLVMNLVLARGTYVTAAAGT